MKRYFIIAVAMLCISACQKGDNIVLSNMLIGKWEYVKVEFYELSETGEKTNFIENAHLTPEYKEIDVPHTIEFTETHALLWTGYRFPSVESKYVLEDDKIFLEEFIGRNDEYVIKTLNKKEMVLSGGEEEFEFGAENPEDFIYPYSFIYYKRVE